VEVGTVSVLVNRGRGRLRPELVYGPVGLDSVAVAIGDLDGDTKPDVVAANNDSGSVSVLFNRPGLCTVQGVWRRPLPAARRTFARANCRVGAIRRVASGLERSGDLAETRVRGSSPGREQGQPRRQPWKALVKKFVALPSVLCRFRNPRNRRDQPLRNRRQDRRRRTHHRSDGR
jgi:hypothetical protein